LKVNHIFNDIVNICEKEEFFDGMARILLYLSISGIRSLLYARKHTKQALHPREKSELRADNSQEP